MTEPRHNEPSHSHNEVPTEPGHNLSMTPTQRVAIYLVLFSTFVVFLNETILGVALPPIMDELRIDPATGQWLLTAFMLTMAIVIPISGWLMQRFSTRQVFLTAITLFTLGTFTAAMAPGFSMLLLGRVLQASGTGVMMPLLMTTVMTLVPPHQRGKMMGNISIVMAVAPALGPTLSGFILNFAHWRALFWFVLPIALVALVLGALKLPNVSEPRKMRVDEASVLLSAFAFGSLIYGLSELGRVADGVAMPVAPWVIILVGAIALAAFLLRQLQLQAANRALIDLRIFAFRGFPSGLTLLAALMAVLFGTIILLPIYAQRAAGLDTMLTGLSVLPGGLLMGFAGPFVGRLYDRFGPRPLIVPGLTLVAIALWGMSWLLVANSPMYMIIALHVVLSAGLALTFTPLFTASLGAIAPPFYSYASAAIGTAQQLAGAAGTALFIVIYTVASNAARDAGASEAATVTAGTQTAFLAGAIAATALIAVGFLVRRPDSELEEPTGTPSKPIASH